MRMRKMQAAFVMVLLAVAVSAHAAGKQRVATPLPPASTAAMQKINPERIRAHVRFLSHDLLEGRGTGQRGGDIAAEYIATQFALVRTEACRATTVPICRKCRWWALRPGPETTFTLVPAKAKRCPLKPLEQYVAYDQTQQHAIRCRRRHCLRRLWDRSAGIQVGRLQGRGREGQSSAHAGERAAFRRREIFQRQGAHLLRALDLQVRRGGAQRRRRRDSDSQDGHGQLSLGSGAEFELG